MALFPLAGLEPFTEDLLVHRDVLQKPLMADLVEKIVPIDITEEDVVALITAAHDVIHGTRVLQARLSWHDASLAQPALLVNAIFYGLTPSLEWRRQSEVKGEFKAVERGWCLGGEEFRQELLEQVKTGPGPSHFGEAVREAAEAGAERLALARLARLGWSEQELKRRRKGDPGKVRLAEELRSQTTMPLAWIARRLCMGSRGYLAWLLPQRKRAGKSGTSAQSMTISLTDPFTRNGQAGCAWTGCWGSGEYPRTARRAGGCLKKGWSGGGRVR